MSGHSDSINPAPIDDMGPLPNRPDIVGICSAHGFWFEMRREEESCPEPRCMATVHVYHWTHHYDPEGEPLDGEHAGPSTTETKAEPSGEAHQQSPHP